MARMPVERTRSNCSSGVFLMMPLRVAMHQELAGLEVRQDDRGDRDLARIDLDARQVDDRHALGLPRRIGDGVDLGAEHATAVGEEQRPVVRVGDEQMLDRVLLARDVADDALAAAMLAPVGRDRLALDVAATRDRDDDVLVGDEVLVGHVAAGVVGHARPPIARVLALQLGELVLDDREDAGGVGEDVLELGDELDDRQVLVLDLLALEGSEAGQAHVEDGLRLQLGEVEARHQVVAGDVHVGRFADRLDDRVEVIEGDLEALEDVRPGARLAEVELGAPADDLAAVRRCGARARCAAAASAAGRRPAPACSC